MHLLLKPLTQASKFAMLKKESTVDLADTWRHCENPQFEGHFMEIFGNQLLFLAPTGVSYQNESFSSK